MNKLYAPILVICLVLYLYLALAATPLFAQLGEQTPSGNVLTSLRCPEPFGKAENTAIKLSSSDVSAQNYIEVAASMNQLVTFYYSIPTYLEGATSHAADRGPYSIRIEDSDGRVLVEKGTGWGIWRDAPLGVLLPDKRLKVFFTAPIFNLVMNPLSRDVTIIVRVECQPFTGTVKLFQSGWASIPVFASPDSPWNEVVVMNVGKLSKVIVYGRTGEWVRIGRPDSELFGYVKADSILPDFIGSDRWTMEDLPSVSSSEVAIDPVLVHLSVHYGEARRPRHDFDSLSLRFRNPDICDQQNLEPGLPRFSCDFQMNLGAPNRSGYIARSLYIPPGEYEVYVDGSRSLSRKFPAKVNISLGQASLVLDFTTSSTNDLVMADYWSDDKINVIDYAEFVKEYRKALQTGNEKDSPADLNGDDDVGILDFRDFRAILLKMAKGDDIEAWEEHFEYQRKKTVLAAATIQPTELQQQANLTLNQRSSGPYQVGADFDIDVMLDTKGASVAGTDVIVRYDPCVMEATRVTAGPTFDVTNYTIDSNGGEVILASDKNSGSFSGAGRVARIRFRVKFGGVNTVVKTFFRPSSTTDSNLVDSSSNQDLLQTEDVETFGLVGLPSKPSIGGEMLLNGASFANTAPYLTTANYSLDVALNSSCATSSITRVDYSMFYDGQWRTLANDDYKPDGWNYQLSTTAIDERAIRLAANVSTISGEQIRFETNELILDRTPPVAQISAPAYLPIDSRLSVTWSATDNFSGIDAYDVYYRNDFSQPWSLILANTTGQAITLEIDRAQDQHFKVFAYDKAGNLSYEGAEAFIPGVTEPESGAAVEVDIQDEAGPQTGNQFAAGETLVLFLLAYNNLSSSIPVEMTWTVVDGQGNVAFTNQTTWDLPSRGLVPLSVKVNSTAFAPGNYLFQGKVSSADGSINSWRTESFDIVRGNMLYLPAVQR